MLPTLRLLIAAMLATVVVLICGFGIFATFRVSHDPIAHLPTAAVPLQMVAEAGAGSDALSAARAGADPRSQFDVPINVPQEAGPATPTVEQRDEAELADERPPAAQSPSATEDAEPSADRDPENESVASVPIEQPGAASPPVTQSPSSQSDARRSDIARDAASEFSLPKPIEVAAEPSTAAIDQAIGATATTPTAPPEDAGDNQPTFAQTPISKIVAALNPETAPAADSHPALKPTPDGATNRSGPETQPKAQLTTARRSASRTAPAITRDEPRRVERPVRTLSATIVAKPRRARIAIARPARAVRFTSSYYEQYAQSADQSYGYGQGDAQGASADQQQAAVRYVGRPRAARLVVRKINSAVGGPFVRARTQ
jgi:hypothetical protein